MSPPHTKFRPPKVDETQIHDQYTVEGKVDGKAVIVQGPNAAVEILQREATPQEIEQQYKTEELLQLRKAINKKYLALREQIKVRNEVVGNPYPFGRALGLEDSEMLAGREEKISELLKRVETKTTTLFVGGGGVGKTSLLQAGLMPTLIKEGHLPIFIPIAKESLSISIKKQFLEAIENTNYLISLPLSAFLRHVIDYLPKGKKLLILIDRFEDFFEGSEIQREEFKREWSLCLFNEQAVHWLFSIHVGCMHQMIFFQPEINPLSERVVLPTLERDSARKAIQAPAAAAGIQVEETVVEDILDRLGVTSIDPSQLQTVCYMLSGGSGTLIKKWTLADYARHGHADGILREALDRILANFPKHEQHNAWQILACLIEIQEEDATLDFISKQLQSYGLRQTDLQSLLEQLENNHLLDMEDGKLRLANSSLKPRIEQWSNQQAVSQKIRQETARQVQRIRNSALRGSFGGAISFAIFDLLIYTGTVPDTSFVIFFTMPMAAIGGIAGILITLTIDLAIAAYHGPRAWLQYVVGGVGGAIAFSIGFLLYANNNYMGDSLLTVLPATIFEGGIWGIAIGLSTTWAKNIHRRVWLNVLMTSFLCGLALLGVEAIWGALVNELWEAPPAWWRIFLAGMLPALLFQATVLSGHPPSPGGTI